MCKMREYVSVSNNDIEDFNREVNRLINKGYKPIGGIALSCEDNAFGVKISRFAQALVLLPAYSPKEDFSGRDK